MDDGKGKFKQVTEEQAAKVIKEQGDDSGIFRKGEILEIKKSTFKVVSVGGREIRLRLLPKFKE